MALSGATKDRLKAALGRKFAADEVDSSLSLNTGDVYFVSSATGADVTERSGLSKDAPFATLNYAITRATASNGDTIVLMPGHAETTTAIAWNKAGIRVVGLGYGRNRPNLTATAAATDLINVTAANGELRNVRLVGAASACTALLDGSSAADDFALYGVHLSLAATPLNAITWSGQRLVIEDLTVRQTANGNDYIVLFEAGVDGFIFKNWDVIASNGIDNGLVGSGAFSHVGYTISDMRLVGIDTLLLNFLSSSGTIDGLVSNVRFSYSAAQTSVEDGVAAATSKGVAYDNVYASDATGKTTGRIPLTSAN